MCILWLPGPSNRPQGPPTDILAVNLPCITGILSSRQTNYLHPMILPFSLPPFSLFYSQLILNEYAKEIQIRVQTSIETLDLQPHGQVSGFLASWNALLAGKNASRLPK